MITKKEAKKNFRETRTALANQITALRKSRKLTIEELGFETGFKKIYLERLELAQLEISLSMGNALARYFDKKVKIELVD